jgi:AbrB family looped-hinge helix DNA binding protein
MPMPIVKVMQHGQITIPKKIRELLGLKEGDLADAELKGERIVITPKRLVEDKALQELRAVLSEVHAKNKGVSEEEVVKYATQAVAELRAEEYAKEKKA